MVIILASIQFKSPLQKVNVSIEKKDQKRLKIIIDDGVKIICPYCGQAMKIHQYRIRKEKIYFKTRYYLGSSGLL